MNYAPFLKYCRCSAYSLFVLGCFLPEISCARNLPLNVVGIEPRKNNNVRVFHEARITVYWQNSDYYTKLLKSSSGVRLKNGMHVAVDPKLIPYGSKIRIEGWGTYTAVDTGSAVIKRTAAKRMGKNVPVVDVFFVSKEEALRATRMNPIFSRVEIIEVAKSSPRI